MPSVHTASLNELDSAGFDILYKGSLHCIRQCEQVLKQLSEASYCQPRDGNSSSIGAHMRHILDRFQCFFSGLADGCIDYDARKRDKSIETSLNAARFSIATITRRLQDLAPVESDEIMVAETVHCGSPRVLIGSSVARELMSLITHTTHHLSIINLMARDLGCCLGDDLGKAPSTIVFEQPQVRPTGSI